MWRYVVRSSWDLCMTDGSSFFLVVRKKGRCEIGFGVGSYISGLYFYQGSEPAKPKGGRYGRYRMYRFRPTSEWMFVQIHRTNDSTCTVGLVFRVMYWYWYLSSAMICIPTWYVLWSSILPSVREAKQSHSRSQMMLDKESQPHSIWTNHSSKTTTRTKTRTNLI